MNSASLLTQLATLQKKLLGLCQTYPQYFHIHYHPDLSPLGWHLGHCVYTETYWIREQLLNIPSPDRDLRSYYTPECSHKLDRGDTLPEHVKLCQWADTRQRENLELIEAHQKTHHHPLMRHHFLLHFLLQHYAQHCEIMHMILVQKALQECVDFEVTRPLISGTLHTATVLIKCGHYDIGSQTHFLPYDNEYPSHQFTTDDIYMAEHPISNSEFLLFMEQSAYQKPEYWSHEGWQWKEKFGIYCPSFWMQDKRQNWFGIDATGPHHLMSLAPVCGLSYFEAQAFAHWSRMRLPHEYEWEAAAKNTGLKNTGKVWEWCENSFHPYAHFKAFPYDGYSMPYFDGTHFVMKGASPYTEGAVRRDSFRNYYQADKRHQFSGCRLVLG